MLIVSCIVSTYFKWTLWFLRFVCFGRGSWADAYFEGVLQADAYAGYDALYRNGKVVGAGCWAHVRRKFFEIDKAQRNGFVREVLESIATLYGIEKSVKGKPAPDRCQVRQARASPVLEALKNNLIKVRSQILKKLPLAKAIHYALVRWESLCALLVMAG